MRVSWNEINCVECGACVAQCPTGALEIDGATWAVRFEKARCAGCERCVPACSYGALGVIEQREELLEKCG